MSYDIYCEIDTGGEKPFAIGDYNINYTSNVAEMYYLAIPKKRYIPVLKEERGGLWSLEGMQCAQAIPIIKEAIVYFVKNRTELEKLNPSNGWGNYKGALKMLENILEMCIDHPKATLRIDA